MTKLLDEIFENTRQGPLPQSAGIASSVVLRELVKAIRKKGLLNGPELSMAKNAALRSVAGSSEEDQEAAAFIRHIFGSPVSGTGS